jgi:hypothetical protein
VALISVFGTSRLRQTATSAAFSSPQCNHACRAPTQLRAARGGFDFPVCHRRADKTRHLLTAALAILQSVHMLFCCQRAARPRRGRAKTPLTNTAGVAHSAQTERTAPRGNPTLTQLANEIVLIFPPPALRSPAPESAHGEEILAMQSQWGSSQAANRFGGCGRSPRRAPDDRGCSGRERQQSQFAE